MKVVINKCYGGFGLSPDAILWLHEKGAECIEKRHYEEYFGLKSEPTKSNGSNLKAYNKALLEWKEYKKTKGKKPFGLYVFDESGEYVLSFSDRYESKNRADKMLVECVKQMGKKSFGECAELEIIDIPDGIQFQIDEYDGMESISEVHRRWG